MSARAFDDVPPSPWRPTATVAASIGLHVAACAGVLLHVEAWQAALAAVAANQGLLTALSMWPRSALLGPNIARLPPESAGRGEIAITFDDGPDPEVTPLLLDMLETAGARATFFCIAGRALRHPELCREMIRRGHGVENHSLDHSHAFAFSGMGGARREILAAQSALHEASGRAPRFFRPPAGTPVVLDVLPSVLEAARALNLRPVALHQAVVS